MRRSALLPILLLVAPAGLSAQAYTSQGAARDNPAIVVLSESRRLNFFPTEIVGFRVTGDASVPRILRASAGHLVSGRLYHAIAIVTHRDGSAALRAEGTLSADEPRLALGFLPAGEYVITMHLEDFATGATRDARNRVVLR